jgi:neutral ceramidase
MRAGVAEVDVTPPVGCWLLGPVAKSTGVHDPLMARALVLDDGAKKIAILGVDLIGMGWELADELHGLIKAETGVDFVLLQFSHTHNAPFPPSWMTSIYKKDVPFLAAWRDGLRKDLPKLVADAIAAAKPVELRAGRAEVQVGFNRRVVQDNGYVTMAENPDGAVVPWVDVLGAYRQDGSLMSVLYEHAAHPVIVHASSTLISADFPGYAAGRIRQKLGDDVVPIFAQGCGANINGSPLATGFDEARAAGDKLGDAVAVALESAQPITADELTLVTKRVDLPCIDFPPREEVVGRLEKARAQLAEQEAEKGEAWPGTHDEVESVGDLLRLLDEGERPLFRLEVAMVGLGGDWGFVSFSGEMFCEYQLWISENAPFKHTMVAAYANNFGGYIACDADLAMGEKGGYEAACWPSGSCALIVPTRVALQVGIEGIVRDAVAEMWAQKA